MKNTKRRRTIQLNVRVTEHERNIISTNASEREMSVSEYLRHLLVIDGKK